MNKNTEVRCRKKPFLLAHRFNGLLYLGRIHLFLL
jgi:hypothetical protein